MDISVDGENSIEGNQQQQQQQNTVKQQLAIAKISCVLYYWQWLRKVKLTFYQKTV